MNNSQIIEDIVELYQKHGASSIAYVCIGLILVLFINALFLHWAAKTLRVQDSRIGKGMLVGFGALPLGLALDFFPIIPDVIHGILTFAFQILLIQKIFQVSFLQSIAIIFLTAVYFLLHAAVAIVAAILLFFD